MWLRDNLSLWVFIVIMVVIIVMMRVSRRLFGIMVLHDGRLGIERLRALKLGSFYTFTRIRQLVFSVMSAGVTSTVGMILRVVNLKTTNVAMNGPLNIVLTVVVFVRNTVVPWICLLV